MKVFESLEEIVRPFQPIILSIGNFDGVHLGHQLILKRVNTLARQDQIPSLVITFKNHPSTILRPNHPIPLLTAFPQKLYLLEEIGIDYVLALEFTKSLSKQSAEQFLRNIHAKLPFRRLILGQNAKLGNDQQGEGPLLVSLASELHFSTEFLFPEMCEQLPISSSRIRQAIQNEDLVGAKNCLGRNYSIYGKVLAGQGAGKRLGYPTANLTLKGLCYPPFGVYVVRVKTRNELFPGVANLGFAPTVRHDHIPLLETHLLDGSTDYGEWIEVIFEEFLRPERSFGSLKELQEQIGKDVESAREYFSNNRSTNSLH